MKNIYKYSLLSFMLISIFSCDNDFEELNTSPNNPTTITVDLQLGRIERTIVNQLYDNFLAGESASAWVQHLSKPVYNDSDRYFPRIGSIGNLWTVLYTDVVNETQNMYQLAAAENNKAVQGVALTLEAIAFQTLTDVYGDVPVLQANNSEFLFPAYDSQQVVYGQILSKLDEAMSLLDGTGSISASQDLMFGGDISKWKKLAASVKFRALMRISETPLFNSADVQSLVSSGNLITDNADNAFISLETENGPNTNPFYSIIQGGRGAEWCVGEALVDFMDADSDPRLAVYANEIEGGGYRGKPAGYFNPGVAGYAAGTVSQIGDAFMTPDAPLYIVTASQINLLLAEAADQGYIGGSAASYFTAGVDASLMQNGLAAGSYSPTYSGYQSIAEQLWVATYMQAYEAWAEWRRSDIPTLTVAVDPQPGVNSVPTRYTYPVAEQTVNAENLAAAIASQGPDTLTHKVDWDKN